MSNTTFAFCLFVLLGLVLSNNCERTQRNKAIYYTTGEHEFAKRILMQQPQQLSQPQQPQMPQEMMPQVSPMSQMSTAFNPMQRAASFMVDPLIIIAMIALPTIGMLGLSSLIMPLIPIGIYLIQQFLPSTTGRRRRSVGVKRIDLDREMLFNQIYNKLDSKFN